MKIALINNPSIGVNYHRLLNPFEPISQNHDIDLVDVVDVNKCDYDLLVFNTLPNQNLTDIEILKNKGVKVIVDIDDWIELPKWHTNAHNNFQRTSLILQSLKVADVVTTTNKTLQNKLRHLGYNSEILENYITDIVPNKADYHSIGWVGGQNHAKDLSLMYNILMTDFGVKRILGGYSKGDPQSEFYARIMSGNYQYNLEKREPLPIDKYKELYQGITIGLLPCYEDIYSICKSDLRALEYASMGIVGVTNGGCYSDTPALQCEYNEFRKKIKRIISEKRFYEEQRERHIEWFKNRNDIKGITEKRKQIIESI